MNILATIRREKRRLEKQVGKLQRELDGLTGAAKALGDAATDGFGTPRKRVMSAAARGKISAAAKRRWAKLRAGAKKRTLHDAATDGLGRPPKRVLSAAARAKISRAAKRRWAKVRAGAKKAVS